MTQRSPDEVITEVFASRLRGRGGAGYPVADKWRAARSAAGDRKIVVANLMGADPTSLGDRTLAEGNPHLVVEGALIAAAAVGAVEAILAVRRDWTAAIERLKAAVADAEAAHLAGYLILGTDVSVQVSVWEGSGAYVAGEETALIHALQGDRGMPLIRPPYPAERGLWDAPTVVHNAETLAHVAWIIGHSAAEFAKIGTGVLARAPSWSPSPARCARPEWRRSPSAPRSTRSSIWPADRPARSRPPSSAARVPARWRPTSWGSTGYAYDALGQAGGHIGSGSVLVTDAATCMVATARFLLDFSAREACGKAVPCRIGPLRLVEALDRILAATPRPNDLVLLRELSAKIADTALCRLESLAPRPMLTTLDRFGDEYRAHAERGVCLAGSCSTDAVNAPADPAARSRRIGPMTFLGDGNGNGKGNGRRNRPAGGLRPHLAGRARHHADHDHDQRPRGRRPRRGRPSSRPAAWRTSRSRPCATSRSCRRTGRAGSAWSRSRARTTPRSVRDPDRGRDGGHHPLRAGHREPAPRPGADLLRPRRLLPAAVPVQVPDPGRHPRLPEGQLRGELGGGDPHPQAVSPVPGHPRPGLPRPVRDPLPARGGGHRDRHPRLASVLRRPGPRGGRPRPAAVAQGGRHRAPGGRHRLWTGRA